MDTDSVIRILGSALADARRTTHPDYREGALDTLDNLLYPFANLLGRTVERLRQDVDRAARRSTLSQRG